MTFRSSPANTVELLGQLSADLVWNGAASRRREIEGSRHPAEARTADEEASEDVSWGAWCACTKTKCRTVRRRR